VSSEHRIKSAVVTGGTDGIGKEIARGLAVNGLRVAIVGRDPIKGTRAAEDIRQTTRNCDVEFLKADLALVHDTNRVAGELARRFGSLHYLVHSAGIVRGRRELTAEGIESNFAANYLNRFALTCQLLSNLAAAGKPDEAARVVVVSGAAQQGKIDFREVNLTSNFATLRAVLQFCHANDVFTIELARHLSEAGLARRVTVTCLKIGVVKTNIRRQFPWWMKFLVPLLLDPLLGQSREEAADAALRLLLAPEFEGLSGALFSKIRKFKQVRPTARALAPDEGSRLWELSERLESKASVSRSSTTGLRVAAFSD
jgi:NAD(P)-dependent dehydrogenase (short-subunit alcohol dehydrogenase family)